MTTILSRLEALEKKQPPLPEKFRYKLTDGQIWETAASPLDIANRPPADREICAWLNPPDLEGQDPLSASFVTWMVDLMHDGGRSFRESIKKSDDVPTR